MFSLCCSLTWVLCCCLLFPLPFRVERCFSLLNPCQCVGGLLVFASIPVLVGILNETSRPLICAACSLTVKHTHVAFEWKHRRQSTRSSLRCDKRRPSSASDNMCNLHSSKTYEGDRVLLVLSRYRTLELKWHCDCTHNQRLLLAWDWK